MADKHGQLAQFILDTVVTVGTAAVVNYERLLGQDRQEHVKQDLEKQITEEMRHQSNAFFQEGRQHPQMQFAGRLCQAPHPS